jgi:hypothetical protein
VAGGKGERHWLKIIGQSAIGNLAIEEHRLNVDRYRYIDNLSAIVD